MALPSPLITHIHTHTHTHTHTAANVLFDYNQQRLKVADFSCAELLEECHRGPCFRGNEKAGTLAYNPPEVSNATGNYE